MMYYERSRKYAKIVSRESQVRYVRDLILSVSGESFVVVGRYGGGVGEIVGPTVRGIERRTRARDPRWGTNEIRSLSPGRFSNALPTTRDGYIRRRAVSTRVYD